MKKHKLHKIAPLLSKIPRKKDEFKVPQDYFDSIEDLVLSNISVKNFHSNSASSFKTPENYFDSIENVIITKLKAEAIQNINDDSIPENYFDSVENNVLTKITSQRKTRSLKRIARITAPIAIAASLLLIFVVNSTSETTSLDSLATSEIEQLIDYGLIDIDTESLTFAFSDIDFSSNNLDAIISDDEVLNYLYEEDLESIIYEN